MAYLTKDEMNYICQSMRCEYSDLHNAKRIAELNDKRFTMQSDFNLCESILSKLQNAID